MPRIRCRYYTESGEPVKTGCRRKGAGCAFVHPGDPDWNSAPPPSSKPRDRGGDAGAVKSWGGNRGNAPPRPSSGWLDGSNAGISTSETWGDVNEWGGAEGWGSWGAGASTWASDQGPGSAHTDNLSTPSRETFTPVNERNHATPSASGTKSSEPAWGGSADTTTPSSGWGGHWNEGWGRSNWGNNDANKTTESGTGASSENKDTDVVSGWGSTWGTGTLGEHQNVANSSRAPDPVVVDRSAEKEAGRNKGSGRTVPAPPRIRIPEYESKKIKITGMNGQQLGPSRWGESRSSNLVATSTPVAISTPGASSTPVTTLTPTDSSRFKRKRDAAQDDKFDVFKEYIKAWERGVRARCSLADAEAKRDRWFRTQKSACYARIGEAGRKRLDGERAECDKEVSVQRDKLSCAISSLVDFHDTFSSNLDLGQRYDISEQAKNFIEESKSFVNQIRALIVEHVLKDRNEAQTGHTQGQASGDATSIGSLRSRVRDVEDRFEQAQTELTLRHRRDIRAEINDLLTDRIDALRQARQREIDRVAAQPRPEIVIPPIALEKIEGTARHVRELDAKIPQAVEDIRLLLLRVDATTKRVSELEQELSANKATYDKVQAMIAQKQETERRIDEQLEKIREQFEQLVASQPPGSAESAASPAVCNSRDKLMDSLRPAFEVLLDQFYAHEVLPTIDALQRVVVQASDRHQEEAIKVLWGKIQPAMNMVAGVSRWLDSQELSHTAPVAI